MAGENRQKVREIFDSALRRKSEERQNYIIEVCGEDDQLKAVLKTQTNNALKLERGIFVVAKVSLALAA